MPPCLYGAIAAIPASRGLGGGGGIPRACLTYKSVEGPHGAGRLPRGALGENALACLTCPGPAGTIFIRLARTCSAYPCLCFSRSKTIGIGGTSWSRPSPTTVRTGPYTAVRWRRHATAGARVARPPACDNHLHQPPDTPGRGRRALHRGPRHRVFGSSRQTVWGFTPHRLAKGQLQLVVLPLGPHEQPALQAPSHRSGLRRANPATMPSADFCGAVAGPCEPASPDCETPRRSPEVSSTAFAAHPPRVKPVG